MKKEFQYNPICKHKNDGKNYTASSIFDDETILKCIKCGDFYEAPHVKQITEKRVEEELVY